MKQNYVRHDAFFTKKCDEITVHPLKMRLVNSSYKCSYIRLLRLLL